MQSLPHPSNLPNLVGTPQVWFGNWYRTSISSTTLPTDYRDHIPPTGGSPLFIEQENAILWYSVVIPGPATFVRMSGYRIFSSGGEHSQPEPLCDFHFKVNRVTRAILTRENNSIDFSVHVNKGDEIAVQVRDVIGDSIVCTVGLVFIPDTPNHFYYAGGSGGVNIIQAQGPTTTLTHWVRRPAFQWRDFVLSDALFSESNTPARARSIVPTRCILRSCFVRIHGNNFFSEASNGISGPFEGLCDVILIKGRGASEEVIGEGQIIGPRGDTEIIMNTILEPGDLVSFALRVLPGGLESLNRPGIYYSCVVESLEPGWFMLGNGQESAPSTQGRIYPLTDAEEDDDLSNSPDTPRNGALSPANMQFKNWYVGIKAADDPFDDDQSPIIYQMYLNHEPSSLMLIVHKEILETPDLQNIDVVKTGDIIYYTGQGGFHLGSDGFTHALAAKVNTISSITNLPRGKIGGNVHNTPFGSGVSLGLR